MISKHCLFAQTNFCVITILEIELNFSIFGVSVSNQEWPSLGGGYLLNQVPLNHSLSLISRLLRKAPKTKRSSAALPETARSRDSEKSAIIIIIKNPKNIWLEKNRRIKYPVPELLNSLEKSRQFYFALKSAIRRSRTPRAAIKQSSDSFYCL